jgi:hypothetical protein
MSPPAVDESQHHPGDLQITYQPAFATYLEYIEPLLSDPSGGVFLGDHYRLLHSHLRGGLLEPTSPPFPGDREQLTLFRVYRSGKPILIHRLRPTPSSTDHITRANAAQGFTTEFRSLISTFTDDVECQIVILEPNRLKPHYESGCRHVLPHPWIIDILGLVLDMDPTVWKFFH